jgi:RimJ/RimL family protein N-acetyltransferase
LLSRAEHDEWFRTWLLPSNRRGFFFIVEELNMPIGMVRFDSKSNQIFEISVIIDPNQQNRGFAKKAIGLALQEILSIHEYFEVAAAVNSQNHPSISLFSKLGFQQEVFEGEFLEFRRSYTRHDFDE